ncbi:MAG: hypothetical protein WCS99_01600 [Limisphaerales bacterium]
MKVVLSEPEIVTRNGKPVSVILPICITIALSLTSLLLCGCASSTTTPISGGNTAPTTVDSIEVLFDPPSRPYKTIGLVTVSTGSIGAKDSVIQREFRSAAAKLGADAVIVESLPAGIFNEQSGRGRAILWLK